MTENKFWLSLWLGLALILSSAICFCTKQSFDMDKEYAKMGYKRTYVSGLGMQWVNEENSAPAK